MTQRPSGLTTTEPAGIDDASRPPRGTCLRTSHSWTPPALAPASRSPLGLKASAVNGLAAAGARPAARGSPEGSPLGMRHKATVLASSLANRTAPDAKVLPSAVNATAVYGPPRG